MSVRAEHVYPPIPIRSNDWRAWWDDQDEGPYGYGATEAAAIADLTENYERAKP